MVHPEATGLDGIGQVEGMELVACHRQLGHQEVALYLVKVMKL